MPGTPPVSPAPCTSWSAPATASRAEPRAGEARSATAVLECRVMKQDPGAEPALEAPLLAEASPEAAPPAEAALAAVSPAETPRAPAARSKKGALTALLAFLLLKAKSLLFLVKALPA